MKKYSHILALCFTIGFGQEHFSFSIIHHKEGPLLAISTNETFPCAGTTIRLHQSWARDTVVVDITGFIQPTPCYQGADAATGNVLLKGIDRDYFILELRRGRENDLWKITKSEQTYKAISINNSFTTLNE